MNKMKWMGLALCLAAGTTLGAGFQLYTEGSAEALGQAAAISGRDDLTSLAWYNPAGLAGAEKATVMAGDTIAQLQVDFTSANGVSNNASMSDEWRHIPHFYYVNPLADDLTFALSVNAPYGLITEWPRDWTGNMVAIYSDLSAMYITPSIAFRGTENLSFAVGFNIVHAEAKLTANRGALGERTVEGDDIGFGYTASMHWDMARDWAFGARIQSRVMLDLEGDAAFTVYPVTSDVEAGLELPASLNFGIANSSINKLTVGLDAVWTEWSSYDELVYDFGGGYPSYDPYNLDDPETIPKRWEDVWSIRLGGEYELTDCLALRCGGVWDQSPIPDATVAPEMPGSNRYMAMAGLGWKKDNIGIDLAYSHLWAEGAKTGDEVVAATEGAAAGEYESVTHIVSLSASYSF